MIRWGSEAEERVWFPLDSAAGYWQGEQPPRRNLIWLRQRANAPLIAR
jgi:hypothetical protein